MDPASSKYGGHVGCFKGIVRKNLRYTTRKQSSCVLKMKEELAKLRKDHEILAFFKNMLWTTTQKKSEFFKVFPANMCEWTSGDIAILMFILPKCEYLDESISRQDVTGLSILYLEPIDFVEIYGISDKHAHLLCRIFQLIATINVPNRAKTNSEEWMIEQCVKKIKGIINAMKFRTKYNKKVDVFAQLESQNSYSKMKKFVSRAVFPPLNSWPEQWLASFVNNLPGLSTVGDTINYHAIDGASASLLSYNIIVRYMSLPRATARILISTLQALDAKCSSDMRLHSRSSGRYTRQKGTRARNCKANRSKRVKMNRGKARAKGRRMPNDSNEGVDQDNPIQKYAAYLESTIKYFGNMYGEVQPEEISLF